MINQSPCRAWTDKLALKPEDLTRAERAALEAHLSTCPSCAAVFADYQLLMARLRARPKPTVEPLPRFSPEFLSAQEDPKRGRSGRDTLVLRKQTRRGKYDTPARSSSMSSGRSTWPQRLNTMAAVLFVALLVGSLILLFSQVHQGKSGKPQGTPLITPAPRSAEHLAFSGTGIFTMYASGSHRTLLTRGLGAIAYPVWSPDGRKIAFSGYSKTRQRGNVVGDIYVMNADGSGLTRLTSNPADDSFPAWSPDGKQIAFVSDRTSVPEIYVINTDGSALTRLTYQTGSTPAWSGDGSHIAFVSLRDGNPEIYVMNADGSNQVRLTQNAAEDEAPTWSPDDKQIAFVSSRDGNPEIYVMNADGSRQIRLTSSPLEDRSPKWSPNSKRLVFSEGRKNSFNQVSSNSSQAGNPEVWVVNADGTGLTQLTSNKAYDLDPVWSPDGTKIAFASNRVGNFDIYVMNADGSHQTQLTNDPLDERFPSWQP
jgi:Tol biopolymer transport system component